MTQPRPPQSCPACGSPVKKQGSGVIVFECGIVLLNKYDDDCGYTGVWEVNVWDHKCSRAFDAAVTLRAERDAALAQVAALTEEVDALAALPPEPGEGVGE